ncbi:N-acetylglucosamine/diacetylchitobiose ABC transporter substrate-binding protein [Myceligenerans crystallogenes]|uniref:N-acetylglucosamine/diacetylchitobiose ABC transporter substrate-binding protein n=1 Tax=Myceligenerans crystallogenes TaxID=316335 RepID=A0ABN2NN49_9MICO
MSTSKFTDSRLAQAALDRRTFVRGAVATALLAPLGGALAGCAVPSGGGGGAATGGAVSADNPFGLASDAEVEAVIFNGGYGFDYVEFAAGEAGKLFPEATFEVAPSTQIAQELQPRFVGGTPPDLVDNSGAGAIGFNTIADQLEELDDVFEANNYEGTRIADTLYPGVQDTGTYNGRFVALNYVMTLYAVWYSASLFEENGWAPPATWQEAIDLGAEAKKADKKLFVWGKEAATYYQTMALDSAIKSGGDEVRLALENLEPNAWSQDAMQETLTALEEIVAKGYFVPGGAGTQFTAAQARWSNDQDALLYPSGGWIENEMKDATAEGFEMTGFPTPATSDSPALGLEAVRAGSGEPFIVPSQAKNPAGGKEILRAMLSTAAATHFSETKLAPTIVKGTVPADGFGSTALAAQTAMLDAAGENTFNYQFVDYYGMNPDQLVVWNEFLSGGLDAKGLTQGLQRISDDIAADDSVEKIEVS